MLRTPSSLPCEFCGFQIQDVRLLTEACRRLLDQRRSLVLENLFWFICFAQILLSPLNNTNCDDSSYGRFGEQVSVFVSLWVSFGVFLISIICIYCYARTGYLRSQILSLDIHVFDTPLYIYNHALVILVRYVIDRSVALSCCGFCLPLFLQRLLVIINYSYYYTY